MELRSAENDVAELVSLYNKLRHVIIKDSNTNKLLSLPSLADDNVILEKKETETKDDNDILVCESQEMTQREVLENLESLCEKIDALAVRTERFRKRLNEKDPITGASRYGEKTTQRVTNLLKTYDNLSTITTTLKNDSSSSSSSSSKPLPITIPSLRQSILHDEDLRHRHALAAANDAIRLESARRDEETKRREQERLNAIRDAAAAAEAARDLRSRAEASRRQRAEESRRREEEEERRRDEERRADAAFVDGIVTVVEGVRMQLKVLRESCRVEGEDPQAHAVAIGALHTVFRQIVAHPEEIKFRRIRRDHAKFHEDIGRHRGGRELLVAAGFCLTTVDGVSCFFSKEPDIEREMDAWSDWFEGLKKTLELIEEDMMK